MTEQQTADWLVSRHGGALVVRVSGLLTLRTANETRGVIRTALIEREAVKIVVDIRLALLLMSDADHAAFVQDIIQSRPFSAPLAVLCTPAQWERAFAHCMGIAQTGRTRFAFASAKQAALWLGVPEAALAVQGPLQAA